MSKYIVFLFFCCPFISKAQNIDHWETVVLNDDLWKYEIGNSTIPSNWKNQDFNDSQWSTGQGGFGYGDGDDNTIIPQGISVFIRTDFELIDTSVINFGMLHADYDDGFVAYLNGVEIARSNFGTVGIQPAYNQTADFHEANLYQGGNPDNFLLSSTIFKSLINEGTNTLAVQIHNQDISSSDMTSNFFLSVGISDNSSNYNATPSWFINPFFSSSLPLIVITTTQTNAIPNEPRVQAHMGIIDNGPSQTNSVIDSFNHYDNFISIETRGESSQMFEKKNYGFETQLETGENNNVALLGMPEENDWILHGPYSDKSLLRNVLAYHMGDVTGRYTPRTRLCEVFINDDYRGVYVLTEKIKRDKNRLDIANLKPEDIEGDEITGGYLFQIDRDNSGVQNAGWYSSFPNRNYYAFDDPDNNELVPIQKAYLQNYFREFEDAMNTADFMENYETYVNVDSWIDYFLITEIGKHIDAYKFSFYMHKTKNSNGGKLNFGPIWDFNLAFGNFNFSCSPNAPGWSYEFEGTCHEAIPFWVKKLVSIPEVQNKMNCRWAELRAAGLRTDSVLRFIDNKALEIGSAAERNFERWPTIGQFVWPNNFIGDTYEDEVTFLKFWINQRLQWMDLMMLGDCNLVTSNNETVSNSQVHIYPNPANNQLSVEISTISTAPISFQVYDALGNFIKSISIDQGNNEIDISSFPNGIFFYQLSADQSPIAKGKFVKIK